MAIVAYTGPPGAGKSHALVKDVILPAVLSGRRVVSNIDGLSPNAIHAYCLDRPKQWQVESADKLGEVVLFHGDDSKAEAGFWPTEETDKAGRACFILPGDLVVYDEWAMYWDAGDKSPAAQQVEAFMRWHRHLTGPTGAACDLAIATQSITDLSRRHRPLLSKSFLFKKLDAVGAKDAYTWHAFDGRLQKVSYQTGHGKYDPAVFPLYKSSSAAGSGNHTELKTNKKLSIWGGWKAKAAIGVPLLLVPVGLWSLYSVYTDLGGGGASPPAQSASGAAPGQPGAAPPPPAPSPYRIVGQIESDIGVRVVVADNEGSTRIVKPDGFDFDNGRPVSGFVDGKPAVAEERLGSAETGSGSLLAGMAAQ